MSANAQDLFQMNLIILIAMSFIKSFTDAEKKKEIDKFKKRENVARNKHLSPVVQNLSLKIRFEETNKFALYLFTVLTKFSFLRFGYFVINRSDWGVAMLFFQLIYMNQLF